jgi:EcsC protein family
MAVTHENRTASHRLEAGSSAAAALVGSMAGTDLGNACAGMTPEDLEQLRWVAEVLGADRGMAMRLGGFVSDQAEGFVDAAGRFIMNNSRFSARRLAEMSLRRLYDTATRGMDTSEIEDGGRRVAAAGRRHKLVSTLSGAATGFVGAPGMLLDIPLTTGLMLRSIAGIARDLGEDPSTEEGRRACLEVFALGTDGTAGAEGQVNYWAARAALSHLAIDGFMRRVATMLGIAFSQRLLTRVVPVAGALAGGAMNYAFMAHYQQMARVHFTLRGLERRYDPDAVRACLDRLVRQNGPRPARSSGDDVRQISD